MGFLWTMSDQSQMNESPPDRPEYFPTGTFVEVVLGWLHRSCQLRFQCETSLWGLLIALWGLLIAMWALLIAL